MSGRRNEKPASGRQEKLPSEPEEKTTGERKEKVPLKVQEGPERAQILFFPAREEGNGGLSPGVRRRGLTWQSAHRTQIRQSGSARVLSFPMHAAGEPAGAERQWDSRELADLANTFRELWEAELLKGRGRDTREMPVRERAMKAGMAAEGTSLRRVVPATAEHVDAGPLCSAVSLIDQIDAELTRLEMQEFEM